MKMKLTANAEIDLMNADELAHVLRSWQKEITTGVRFRQFAGQATVAGGVWSMTNQQLGPDPGMVWAVTRVAIGGNGITVGTDLFNAYVGEVSPSKLIESGISRGARWILPTVVLNGPEQLVFQGAGTNGAGTDVTISGAAIELPQQLAWQLL